MKTNTTRSTSIRYQSLCAVIAFALSSTVSIADTKDAEIDYLLREMGTSGCTFIRSGKRYKGIAAREYLASKRQRNAQFINSAEEFIEKIASKSSTSGEPYYIDCLGKEEQPAGEWFTALLIKRRNSE